MMQRPSPTRAITDAASLALAIGALASVAAINGFPLLFSDSGDYIRSAARLAPTWNRPVFYGLFIAGSQQFLGLWGVVAAQAALTVALLHLFLRATLGTGAAVTLAMTLVLAVGSSLPWFAGQIMPDLLTALLALAAYLLLFERESLGPWARLLCLGIALLAAAAHLGNMLLILGMLPLALLYRWIDPARRLAVAGLVELAAVAALSVGLQIASNAMAFGRASLSESGSTYMLSRLIETGLARKYLDAHCANERYVLCDFRHVLDTTGGWYVFSTRSPFRRVWNRGVDYTDYHIGARAAHAEAMAVIIGTVREFPLQTLSQMAVATARQFVSFRTADGILDYVGRDWVEGPIAAHHPEGLGAFHSSLQSRGLLPLGAVRLSHLLVVDAAVLVILFLLLRYGVRERWQRDFLLHLAAVLLLNAAILGILGGPYDRYQSRVVWLVVLAAGAMAWSCRNLLLSRDAETDKRNAASSVEGRL